MLPMRKLSSERLSEFPKVLQLDGARAEIQTQVFVVPKPMVFPLYHATSSSSYKMAFLLYSSHLPIMLDPELFPDPSAEPGIEAEVVSALTGRVRVFCTKHLDLYIGIG